MNIWAEAPENNRYLDAALWLFPQQNSLLSLFFMLSNFATSHHSGKDRYRPAVTNGLSQRARLSGTRFSTDCHSPLRRS
jgi:hypothetical protein